MTILWGKDKDLDYWTAVRAGVVPDAEKRAMALLASISDEQRFSFYCMAGMFPAMGNVTKRTYMIRRWTTVLELEDGRPRASWCILAQDRMVAPETDHVVAMKNIVEGNEMAFREVGNPFHYGHDPFRGRVEAKTEFLNPYLAPIGPDARPPAPDDPSDWNEDAALLFRNREGWMKALTLKGEIHRQLAIEKADQVHARAAGFRQWLVRDALVERAKDWVRIPPKERYKLPPTEFERATARAMNTLQGMAGGFINNSGTITGDTTNGTINITNCVFTNAGTAMPALYFNVAQQPVNVV
jgi:hypothetical protein